MKAKINSKSKSGLETINTAKFIIMTNCIVLPVAVLQDSVWWLIAAFRKLKSSYPVSQSFLQWITVKLFKIQLICNVK